MVTKGHDFEDVSLSVIILADSMLNSDNYRGAEESFQTLVQIIGRAGRKKDEKGMALIQTYNPDNYILDLAKKQDYKAFYESEIGIRKIMNYPPFTDIIVISVFARTNLEAEKISKNIYKVLDFSKPNIDKLLKEDENIQIYPPQEYRLNKIKKMYRWKLIIKGKMSNNLAKWIENAVSYIKYPKEAYISIDLNPYNI